MATSVQLSFADLEAVRDAGPVPVAPGVHESRPDKDPVSGSADRAALAALEAALADARASADDRPPLLVVASYLGQLGVSGTVASSPASVVGGASLRQARDDWLRRLETAQKSESAVVAYRVAIDDLLDWSEANRRTVRDETAVVDYLTWYRQRAQPAPATY